MSCPIAQLMYPVLFVSHGRFTGSAKGIGYSIAQRLADDGVDIVINDLPSQLSKVNEVVEEIKKKGRRAIGVVGDVSKEDDVKQLVEKAVAELGSVDVVSNFTVCSTRTMRANHLVFYQIDDRECRYSQGRQISRR